LSIPERRRIEWTVPRREHTMPAKKKTKKPAARKTTKRKAAKKRTRR
jgi:hypothetical protein